MITIRKISAEEASIESAWVDDMPAWWRVVNKSVSTFTRGPITRLGVFDDGIGWRDELVAIYTLQEIGSGIIDAHLSCRRRIKPDVLIESAKAVKRKLLSSGYATIFLWPLRRNFGLIRIAKMCGFQPTGVRMLQGQLGGRPAEWVQMGVNNVN